LDINDVRIAVDDNQMIGRVAREKVLSGLKNSTAVFV
jgi:hypothetical protein